MNVYKAYVDVLAEFKRDGRMIPRTLTWEDGQVYEIDKVIDIRRAASLKAGGRGVRYTCVISGIESHLFFEEDRRWFVERKEAVKS